MLFQLKDDDIKTITEKEIKKFSNEELIRWIYENSDDFYNVSEGLYIDFPEFGIELEYNWNDLFNYIKREKNSDFVKDECRQGIIECGTACGDIDWKFFEESDDYDEFVERIRENVKKAYHYDDEYDSSEIEERTTDEVTEFFCNIYYAIEEKFDRNLIYENIKEIRENIIENLSEKEMEM